jgi:hypothetical protein
MAGKLVASVVLVLVGLLFFFNNKNMGEGMFAFYRKLYTKNNLKIMFRAAGVVLVVGGIMLMVIR